MSAPAPTTIRVGLGGRGAQRAEQAAPEQAAEEPLSTETASFNLWVGDTAAIILAITLAAIFVLLV